MSLDSSLGIDFLAPPNEVAYSLIGVILMLNGVGGRIVEVEAYDYKDPASHCFGGMTPRNQVMFGPPCRAYVYRSYGIHWCFNIVCCPPGHGAGVLIRALEPLTGLEVMRARRSLDNIRLLCAGPGRLCQALGITMACSGMPVDTPPFQLLPATAKATVVTGPRIGISKAKEVPWRFGLAGSRFLSHPFR